MNDIGQVRLDLIIKSQAPQPLDPLPGCQCWVCFLGWYQELMNENLGDC